MAKFAGADRSRELARPINELQLSSTGTYPISTHLFVPLTLGGVLGLHDKLLSILVSYTEDTLEEQAKTCTSS